MANIVYKTSCIPDWIKVAENLRSDLDWEPKYWLAPPSYKKQVKDAFPDAVYHVTTNASRGVLSEEIDEDEILQPIDKEMLERYRKYEPTALKMMDRQDTGNMTGDRFGYNERKRLYRKLIMYWEGVIEKFDIDGAVFVFAPHMIFDYILYAVCLENDVETAMFTVTSIPNTYYIRDRIHRTPDELHSIDSDENISEDIQKYIEDLRADYSTGRPGYMRDLNFKDYLSKLSNVSKYPWYLNYVFDKVFPSEVPPGVRHYKQKGELIEKSSMNRLQFMRYNMRTKRYKSKLSTYYSKLTESVDTDSQYVFFSLHYQPERTTCPEGGVFVDQYVAVNLLADCLPDNWELYVKEHPHQVSQKYKGEMGRRKFMYDDLNGIEEVTLVDMDLNPFRLIDGAEATATVTGTSGWESINRGTPAIVFGSAWYRDCPGCIQVETRQEVEKALTKIREGDITDEKAIRRFVNELEKISHKLYVTEGTKSDSISEKENIKEISTALSEWWDNKALIAANRESTNS